MDIETIIEAQDNARRMLVGIIEAAGGDITHETRHEGEAETTDAGSWTIEAVMDGISLVFTIAEPEWAEDARSQA